MSSSPSQPLAGRRIWIAGIGGAGMSAYALVAHAWGAEVGGLGPRRDAVPRALLDGHRRRRSRRSRRRRRTAGRSYVSTAFAGRVEGRPRAELLAELVSLRRSIVVAGAHGKTTTSAMIAFCLDRLGLDPTFLIGGEVAAARRQRAARGRAGSSSRATSPTARSQRCGREVAVAARTSTSTTTRRSASRAEVRGAVRALARARAAGRARRGARAGRRSSSRVPGEHNRRNAAAAIAALELAGVARADAERVIVEFAAPAGGSSAKGEAGGVARARQLRAPSGRARRRPRRGARRRAAACSSLFQPHLYSRTRHLAHEFAVALAAADAVCVTDVYPAREEPVPGVSGRLIVEELAQVAAGHAARAGRRRSRRARALVASWARAGDTVLTLGAGDVDRAAPLLLEALA